MKICKNHSLLIKNVVNNIISKKGKKIKIIDLRKKINCLFNYFIICDCKSTLHVKTIYNEIILSIKKFNIIPLNIEGINNYKWVLIDCNFLIINIFLKKIRKFYNIDSFWKKYPKIEYKN